MDKKTLEALNNFALALEQLVDSMESKAKEDEDSGGFGGLFSGQQDINNTLVRISSKIDKLESGNKAIIKNQEKILNMTKDIKSDNDSNNLFSFGNNKESKSAVKDGVGTILLIAGGVLAIGLAFKLIGSVDFISVIALSIAIPLIATAFVMTAFVMKEFDISVKDVLLSSIALISMSLALTVSSWILKGLSVIGVKQLITAIAIAATFSLVAYSIAIMAATISDIKARDLIMLPLVLITLSIAITASSFILSMIQPVAISQFITAIAISVVFVILAYSISELTKNLKGVKVSDLIILPMMLATMSMAIVLSSIILGYTQPIAIGLLFNIALQAVALGIIGIALAIPLYIFKKTGIGVSDAFKGGLIIVIIAGTLMVSSLLINLGTYDNFPSVKWAMGTGLAVMAFTLPIVALGLISMTGIGFGAIVLGALSSVIVATAITGVSHVISKGNYQTNGDILKWSAGVSLLFMTFTPLMIVLGALKGLTSLLSLGLASDPIESGKIMMIKIGETIRDVSFTLAGGNYTGGPTKEWAEGVGLAIGSFAPVFTSLQNSNVLSLFGGSSMSSKDYADTIVNISNSILDAANVFRKGPTNWGGHPTKEWAEGVGLSIAAFAPVFKILSDNGVLDSIFGTTVSTEDMSSAIKLISQTIMQSADLFSNFTGSYAGGPTKEWAEGVGLSISAFAPIFKVLTDNGVLDSIFETTVTPEAMSSVIKMVSKSIMESAEIFSNFTGSYASAPTKEWGEGVGAAILAFANIYDWMYAGINYDVDDIVTGRAMLNEMSNSILDVGRILAPLSDVQAPNVDTIKEIGRALLMWKKVIDMTDSMSIMGFVTTSWAIEGLAHGAEKLTKAINGLNEALGSLQTNQLHALTDITGTLISFSVMDVDNFEDIMDVIDDKSETLAELFSTAKKNLDKSQTDSNFSITDPNRLANNSDKTIKTTKSITKELSKKTIDDLYNMLEAMNGQLSQISSNSSNLSKYANELRSNPDIKIK